MVEGFIFGFISWISLIISWCHLPSFVKEISLKHPLITDACTTGFTYIAISSITHSLVGAVACMVAGLLMEVSLLCLKTYRSYLGKE